MGFRKDHLRLLPLNRKERVSRIQDGNCETANAGTYHDDDRMEINANRDKKVKINSDVGRSRYHTILDSKIRHYD